MFLGLVRASLERSNPPATTTSQGLETGASTHDAASTSG
jgi:hypothetical protein